MAGVAVGRGALGWRVFGGGREARSGQSGAGSELRISCEVLDVAELFWRGARSEKRAERGGE